MSLDAATVRRVAALSRIRLEEHEVEAARAELDGILGWIEQLRAVDTEGVAPLLGAAQVALRLRDDVVTEGDRRDAVLANAPDRGPDGDGAFFAVPKVVE